MSNNRKTASFWLLLGGAALFFLLILIIGNILVIGAKLGALHPAAEAGFYLLTLLLAFFLFVRPVLAVLKAPAIPLQAFAANGTVPEAAACRRVARRLLKYGRLSAEERARLQETLQLGGDLCEPLRALFAQRAQQMTALVARNAKLVFVATAVSQNGRLDAVMVIATNFRMLRELVECLGFRPPLPQLARMYATVLAAALIAEGLEDLQLEQVFPNLGMGVLGAIPGFQLIAASLLQGIGNAFLTLRLGVLAKNYLLAGGQNFVRQQARRVANREAVKLLSPVVKDGLVIMPVSLKEAWGKLF